MSDEIANQHIKNTAKSVEKLLEVPNKYIILWLAYQQVQIFERFKSNNNFMNIVNQFGNSDVINTINETIVALKTYEKRKIIWVNPNKNEVYYFLVNLTESTFSCRFG